MFRAVRTSRSGDQWGHRRAVRPARPLNEFRIVETVAFTLTGAVLVVVCLNISGMMLVHGAMRERELSIRHAIGATRGRLARYLLSEAIVLAGLGALLGSVVLFNGPHLLAWAGRPLPFEVEQALRFDLSIVSIGVALRLATSVVFGLVPATRFSQPVITSSLKDDAGIGGFQAGRAHRLTAALQVAIAVPLIVLSAIALDRVRVTATGNLGFESDLLYAAPLTFEGVTDKSVASVGSRLRSARDNLAKAGGVASATVADGLPLDLQSRNARVSLQVDKNSVSRAVIVHTTRVGDGYLDTMDVPLLVGRGFTHDDSADGEMVTIISKTLADQVAPIDLSIVGKRLTFGCPAWPSDSSSRSASFAFRATGIRLSNAEPLAYVVGAAIAVLVAVLASLAHARRAASIQPMVAMRSI